MLPNDSRSPEDLFLELRRKVRDAELLSAATEKLLLGVRFSGRLVVVVENGRVLKSGYEEGYFRPAAGFAPARLHSRPRSAHRQHRLLSG